MQPKLTIGASNDPLEHEADRIANQVLATPANTVVYGSPPRIQRFTGQPTGRLATAPESVELVLANPGSPLSTELQTDFSQRFGHDLSRVRVHSGAAAELSAREVNAHAYTVGDNIVFGSGRFAPGTQEGRRLIAHELTHVLQQSGADLHREPDSVGEAKTDVEVNNKLPPPPTELAAEGSGILQGVDRIVISCNEMKLRLSTPNRVYLYRMERCSLPIGSFEAKVTLDENDFKLDFGNVVGDNQRFDFSYVVDPGQTNPAVLLRKQSIVHVEVVERIDSPHESKKKDIPMKPQCAARLADRELVHADSFTRELFKPMKFDHTIWSQSVPLGMFGWLDLTASASGGLTGSIFGKYGPGKLSEICLTELIDQQSSSSPIKHPMLSNASRTDVTTYFIGGRARFRLPASAVLRIAGRGRLKIKGEYLSVFDIAEFSAGLSANGVASVSGEINGQVNLIAQATHSTANLVPFGSLPLSVRIQNSTIDKVDLTAEVGLKARAGMHFSLNADAGLSVAGLDIWRQDWNLLDYEAGVAWSGGLKYSPNPGAHWNFGALETGDSKDDDPDDNEPVHEDAAEFDADDIIEAIINENDAQITAPDGLTEATALPFDWYKPLELYPAVVEIPNADDPEEVHRDSGPTMVRYQVGGRTEYDEIGVADWPAARRTFQLTPYDSRIAPEQSRFNRLLDRLGYDRSGTDAEHVWDLNLRGVEFDRFDNLWPASNQEQQLAGTRHTNQMRNYRATIPDLNGRWFIISRMRHPA